MAMNMDSGKILWVQQVEYGDVWHNANCPSGPPPTGFPPRSAGRVPAQRDTLYSIIHTYSDGEDPESPLDKIDDAEARFGSYRRLIASGEFRFTRG